MNRSLRLRLLIATSVSSVIVLTLLGASIYVSMWRLLIRDYDASLMAKARALSATTEQRDGRVKTEFDPKQMPEFSAREHPEYFEMWVDGKQVIQRSESLQNADLPNTPQLARARSGSLRLPGTHHGRAVVLTFTPRIENESNRRATTAPTRTCTIAVAGTPVEADGMLRYLGWLLLALCGSAIALSGAILMRVASSTIRPVRELAREIESLRETELSTRLEPNDVPLELSPVVEKLNGLLNRLEKAFAREKAFTADVAHELRTPLAALMAALELAVSRQREAPAYVVTINECRTITERMQSMVENLLMLARADAGQLPVERQHVNVSALLKESWLMFENRADARNLRVQWSVPEQCNAETDCAKLRIILQNLFDNAVCYCNESGIIRVGCSTLGPDLTIEIANTGSTVRAEDAPRLFQRFWRGDQERSETQIHCGLGLSLSHRLTSLLGGTITIQTNIGKEFIVGLTVRCASHGACNEFPDPSARSGLLTATC